MEEPDSLLTGKAAPKLKLNKKVQVIIACFIFSTLCWFLIAMSKEYVAHVKFRLNYVNLPEGYSVASELPETIKLTIKTSGFRILSTQVSKTFTPLNVDVVSKLPSTSHVPPHVALPTRALSGDFVPFLGDEFTILSYAPDTILFSFAKTSDSEHK
jgi:hypothetical protein